MHPSLRVAWTIGSDHWEHTCDRVTLGDHLQMLNYDPLSDLYCLDITLDVTVCDHVEILAVE